MAWTGSRCRCHQMLFRVCFKTCDPITAWEMLMSLAGMTVTSPWWGEQLQDDTWGLGLA